MHDVVLVRHEAAELARMLERTVRRHGVGEEEAELRLLRAARDGRALVAVDLDGAALRRPHVGRGVLRLQREHVHVRRIRERARIDQEEELALDVVRVVDDDAVVLHEAVGGAAGGEAELARRDIAALLRAYHLEVERPELAARHEPEVARRDAARQVA